MNNWDKRRVFGRVFELFDVVDSNYIRALEIGAGNKINNVVVDNEDTSTYMLKHNIIG